jgi:hypothetical protein
MLHLEQHRAATAAAERACGTALVASWQTMRTQSVETRLAWLETALARMEGHAASASETAVREGWARLAQDQGAVFTTGARLRHAWESASVGAEDELPPLSALRRGLWRDPGYRALSPAARLLLLVVAGSAGFRRSLWTNEAVTTVAGPLPADVIDAGLGALAAAGWIVRQDWVAEQRDGRVVAASVQAFEPFGRRRA